MKNLKFYLLILTLSSSVILLSFILLPKEEIGRKQLFNEFISQFDKTELPYEISTPAVQLDNSNIETALIPIQSANSERIISHNFSAFVPGLARSMFSRMPPDRYHFKDLVFENENFVIVTYGIQNYVSQVPNTINEYVLASYSKDKKVKDVDRLISLRTVAKDDYLQLSKSTIGEDLMIKTTVYAKVKDEEGKLEKSNEASTQKYKIAEDGKIKVVLSKKVSKKQEIIRAN